MSRSTTYLNVINMYRLGIVKIYQKMIKEEPEAGRSKGALFFKENMTTPRKTLTVFTETNLCGPYLRLFLKVCGSSHFIKATPVGILGTTHSRRVD